MQTTDLDPHAALAVFHAVVALCYSTGLDEGKPVAVPSLNKGMHMLKRAAQAIARLRGPDYHRIAHAMAGLLKQARLRLDKAAADQQHACCAAAELPTLSHQAVMAQLQYFQFQVPQNLGVNPSASLDSARVAITNLAPISAPAQMDAGAIWEWAERLQSGKASTQQRTYMIHVIEDWFFQTGIRLGDPEQTSPDLCKAQQLAELYFQQVLQFEEAHASRHTSDKHTDMLKVELRSKETLAAWVMLCLAHSAAATEFDSLRKYALPVQPDDLRHLVLRDGRARQAAQVVAGYVAAANCAASRGRIFSINADATEALASQYADESPALQLKLSEEQSLAERRVEAHWQKILKMQDVVRDLEKQLETAEEELQGKQVAEDRALGALESAIQKATELHNEKERAFSDYTEQQERNISNHPLFWVGLLRCQEANRRAYQAMEEYKTLHRELKAAAGQLSSLKGDMVSNTCRTQPGMAYHKAKQETRLAKQKVADLTRRLDAAKQPPPHVYQPLPNPMTCTTACQALLFFIYPQLTGSFPLLRQYCCAAQQCLVPVTDSGKPVPHGHQCSNRRADSWSTYYNRSQKGCKYVPQPSRAGPGDGSGQLVMYRQQKPPPQSEFGPQDVMEYTSPGIGVWWPSGDMSLRLWQGGPVARYSCSQFVDPFGAHDAVATARSFTEPGTYQSWMQVASCKAASELCLDCPGCAGGSWCCGKYLFGDTTEDVEAARGNRVLAEQRTRPEGMTAEQWRAFAALRAYPLQQLRVLCVALREGHLMFECPQVRPASAVFSGSKDALQRAHHADGWTWMQVAAAVRMALYHVGQLQMRDRRVQRFWLDEGWEVEALCAEMLRQADVMEPAPKLLLQVRPLNWQPPR